MPGTHVRADVRVGRRWFYACASDSTPGSTPEAPHVSSNSKSDSDIPTRPHDAPRDSARDGDHDGDRLDARNGEGLIFCGMCGALNPAGRFYCAACGTTLVDAFHATEGLRVFERPDPAARLIEILPSGGELEVIEDAAAPADWVRIRLPYGRLGYVRIADAAASTAPPAGPTASRPPDINTNARGCVTSSAALWALALLVVTALFGVVIVFRARPQDAGLLGIVFCITLGPMILLTIGAYIAARTREDRLAYEESQRQEEMQRAVVDPPA